MRTKFVALMGLVLCVLSSGVASAQVDYAALITATKPDVDTSALATNAGSELIGWWLPIVAFSILFAFARYGVRKLKGAPNGAV